MAEEKISDFFDGVRFPKPAPNRIDKKLEPTNKERTINEYV